MKKCLVLSSGGLDSTVCTAYAVKTYGNENVVTASLYYGQAHDKELKCAKKVADTYNVRHIQEDISSVMKYAGDVCSLMKDSVIQMNDISYAEQIEKFGKPNTEVPMRNGIFLVLAASIAMSIFPDEEIVIVYGAHSDDAAGNAYPDCSIEFADTADKLIQIGSRGLVSLERPLINLNKAEVVRMGLDLGVDFSTTWSCYHGRDCACSVCGTCRDRIAAFRANNAIDPIEYEGEDPFADMRGDK